MNASPYKINALIEGRESTIHALLKSEDGMSFIPMHLDNSTCEYLLGWETGEMDASHELTMEFLLSSWAALGLKLESLMIDYIPEHGGLIPIVTLYQNCFDKVFVYFSSFIPINVAVHISLKEDIPLHLTESTGVALKKMSMETIGSYIKDIGVPEDGKNDQE